MSNTLQYSGEDEQYSGEDGQYSGGDEQYITVVRMNNTVQ